MNILVIDDSIAIVSLVTDLLKAEGYNVIEAYDGKEGLLKLFKTQIDLIITDLHMPHMDGIELLKKVRKSQQYKKTPVIMLTTESQKEKVVEAITFGVNAWVLKPFTSKEFIEIVKKSLEN